MRCPLCGDEFEFTEGSQVLLPSEDKIRVCPECFYNITEQNAYEAEDRGTFEVQGGYR